MKRLLRERNRTPEWRGSAPCPGATQICLALKAFFQVTLANRKSDNWITPLSQNSLPITRGQRLLVADQQIQHDKVELIHHLRQLQINQNEWSTLSEGREERYPMSTKKESVDDLSISRSNTSPQTAYRQIHPCYSKWWKPLPRISQWRSIVFPSVPSLFQLNATEESCGLCRADTVFRSFLCVSPIHSIGTDIWQYLCVFRNPNVLCCNG